MNVTRHGRRKMKERCGVGKAISNNVASKAFKKGIKHKDIPNGNLNGWVNKVYLKRKTANNIRLYNHKCFLFCGVNLVTVLNIPNNLIEEYERISERK